jgi:hypothetical protein
MLTFIKEGGWGMDVERLLGVATKWDGPISESQVIY